jgi:predicted AAA+ superfamily ATPase
VYIHRDLEKIVLQANQAFSVVLVTGPRQVGKTTLLKKLAEKSRRYVTLDNPMVIDEVKRDPSLFLQRHPPPVLIDEVQYAPELFPYIKMHADTHKNKGDFWMTSSQLFHLMKNVSESLAGRVGIVNMLGLSNAEIHNHTSTPYETNPSALQQRIKNAKPLQLKEMYQQIFMGSMPALYETKQDLEFYFSSYVNTYLQRDVQDLTQVGDLLVFLRFMTSCAARTGQMLNYSAIANDVGISGPTAKKWLSILVTSGIIVLVEPYFNNRLKRIIKSPVMYFVDTGLCAYLTRWSDSETLEVSSMAGTFFETWVVSEIIKSYYNAGKRPPIYYYRDTDNKEIDLIIEQNNTLYPIEIKKSSNPKGDAIKNFKVLKQTGKKIGTGNVICLCDQLYPIDRSNYLVPAWVI